MSSCDDHVAITYDDIVINGVTWRIYKCVCGAETSRQKI